MRLFSIVAIFITSTFVSVAFADSMTCDVLTGLGEDESGEMKVEYRQVGADRWIVSSVDLIILGAEESATRIFDNLNRGVTKLIIVLPMTMNFRIFLKRFVYIQSARLRHQ